MKWDFTFGVIVGLTGKQLRFYEMGITEELL
jgi:hypothetical protein